MRTETLTVWLQVGRDERSWWFRPRLVRAASSEPRERHAATRALIRVDLRIPESLLSDPTARLVIDVPEPDQAVTGTAEPQP